MHCQKDRKVNYGSKYVSPNIYMCVCVVLVQENQSLRIH